jgi:hypothetical protein
MIRFLFAIAFAVPSDPSWHLIKDDHGCDVWTSSPGGQICGEPPIIDGGNNE